MRKFIIAVGKDVRATHRIESNLKDAADRIIAEIKDFERIDHIVTQKANEAVDRTNHRLNTILGCVTLVAALGIWPILNWYRDYVKATVTAQYVKDEVQSVVVDQVPQMITDNTKVAEQKIRADFSAVVSNEVSVIHEAEDVLSQKLLEAEKRFDLIAKIYAARAGGRKEYDAICQVARSTNFLARLAGDAVKDIQTSYTERKYQFGGMKITLSGKHAPEDLLSGKQLLVAIVRLDSDRNTDGALTELTDTKQKQFVATFCYAVKNSKRLNSVYLAIRGIERCANVDFPALGIDEVLKWWMQNSKNEEYHSAYEQYWDMSMEGGFKILPGESPDQYAWRKILKLESILKKVPDAYLAASALLPLAIFMRCEGEQSQQRDKIVDFTLDYYAKHVPKTDEWYVYKALFLGKTGKWDDLVRLCNSRIKEKPTFENELKKWGLFTDAFFDSDEIAWPSKTKNKGE